VAYLAGTRFAVYWVARAVQNGSTPETSAREYELPLNRVRAALAYAAAFPEDMESDLAQAQANRTWTESSLIRNDAVGI
jgi:uncharacterized protein (DUF433 family)